MSIVHVQSCNKLSSETALLASQSATLLLE